MKMVVAGIIICFSLSVSGCKGQTKPSLTSTVSDTVSARIATSPSSTITAAKPIVQSTLSPTFTITKSLSPTATRTPTRTSTKIRPTRSPTFTPQPAYIEKCLEVVDSLPADLSIVGNLLYRRQDYSTIYTYSLSERQKHLFPIAPGADFSYYYYYMGGEHSLSPDGKWLAYIVSEVDSSGFRTKSRVLHLVSHDGYIYDLSYWIQDWQYIIGWLDNQRLTLSLPERPKGSVTILNPFSGQVEKIIPGFFDFEPGYWPLPWPLYNFSLTRVVYPVKGFYYRLNVMDLTTGKKVSNNVGYDAYPIWSPDGKILALPLQEENSSDQAFYLIDQDMKKTQITYPENAVPNRLVNYEAYRWSPDSHYIATWMHILRLDEMYSDRWHLGLIDVQEKKAIDLCIETSQIYYATIAWAPEGRWFVTSYLAKDRQIYQDYYTYIFKTIIVDTVTNTAYRLPDDMVVMEWMAGK